HHAFAIGGVEQDGVDAGVALWKGSQRRIAMGRTLVGEYHLHAGRGQRARNAETNATGATGDECGPALDVGERLLNRSGFAGHISSCPAVVEVQDSAGGDLFRAKAAGWRRRGRTRKVVALESAPRAGVVQW